MFSSNFFKIFAFLFFSFYATISQASSIVDLTKSFATDFSALKVPVFDYSYEVNFAKMQTLPGIKKQIALFLDYKNKMNAIDANTLSLREKYLYLQLAYQLQLQMDRANLEKEFREKHNNFPIPKDGLYRLPHHREWYRLYVRRWTASEISFEELWKLGFREIRKVQREIAVIQDELGYTGRDKEFYEHLNADSFFITDEQAVIDAYNDIQATTKKSLATLFSDVNVPNVDIKPIPDVNADSPPGYYDGDFRFNFFHAKHNTRSMDWLFIHEAIPGHHYHSTLEDRLTNLAPEFSKLFWYPGCSEGWGAYTEHLGKDIGLYQDPYKILGKWEWDLVRSARVIMDVGINLLGWTDSKALGFWKKNIPNQDGIAQREFNRMRRWPAQVLSYKVGEDKILQLRKEAQKVQGATFDIKAFHAAFMSQGSLPLNVLEVVIRDSWK